MIFALGKIKLIENREFKTRIDETSNTILDNFEIFFDNYDFLNKNIDKENLKQELKKVKI